MNLLPPMVKTLIGVNLALFLLGLLPGGIFHGEQIDMAERLLQHAALFPLGDPRFMPWQFFTYMFLHGGLIHIFFNMLMLFMFGVELEHLWGSKRFLIYYLTCGVGAGVVHTIVTFALGDGAPTVGASGAIMGVMVAFAFINPDRIIYLMFPPIPLKAKYMVMMLIGMDLVFGVASPAGDQVARFAHLGGALVGFIFLKLGGTLTLGGIFDRRRRQQQVPEPPRRWEPANVIDIHHREVLPPQPHPTMEFGDEQQRIDDILDKISRDGYQSLSEEEKAVLLEASRKLR